MTKAELIGKVAKDASLTIMLLMVPLIPTRHANLLKSRVQLQGGTPIY